MSRKAKEEYYRFFSVTEPRTHEKGHTEYKVTARFVSRRSPEDVKEVLVWRRFSELKKLHGELSYTHRNLFRRQEDFPAFPRAQLFGRFDEAVIEERRKAAEEMLLFTTRIPALYNSPQLKDFFRGGEVTRPLDLSSSSSSCPLPPPLIPLPRRRLSDCLPAEEEEGREAPPPAQDGGLEAELGEAEVAAEAYSEVGSPGEEEEEAMPPEATPPEATPPEATPPEATPPEATPTEETDEETTLPGDEFEELDYRGPSPDPPCVRHDQSHDQSQEEFDSLFDSLGAEEEATPPPPPLSDNDLAIFDPCAKEEHTSSTNSHSELLSLPPSNPEGEEAGYLSQAANELTAAMESERAGAYGRAILRYRSAVDLLITGVKADPNPQRRESVKRRTAQYLQHAEMLLSLQFSPT